MTFTSTSSTLWREQHKQAQLTHVNKRAHKKENPLCLAVLNNHAASVCSHTHTPKHVCFLLVGMWLESDRWFCLSSVLQYQPGCPWFCTTHVWHQKTSDSADMVQERVGSLLLPVSLWNVNSNSCGCVNNSVVVFNHYMKKKNHPKWFFKVITVDLEPSASLNCWVAHFSPCWCFISTTDNKSSVILEAIKSRHSKKNSLPSSCVSLFSPPPI